jgi:REP element-mobilizing transposase RayT
MAHSFTAGYAHFVFSTKGREPIISTDTKRLHEYIGGIVRSEDCSLLSAGGMPDHLHLLIHMHPSKSYSELMRVVKSRSSAWIKETLPENSAFGWQSGYGGFSVSRSNVDAVREYIATQAEHHKRLSFQEEFIALLEKHGIEYDPKYIWT